MSCLSTCCSDCGKLLLVLCFYLFWLFVFVFFLIVQLLWLVIVIVFCLITLCIPLCYSVIKVLWNDNLDPLKLQCIVVFAPILLWAAPVLKPQMVFELKFAEAIKSGVK